VSVSDVSGTLAIIQEFVDLSIKRRRHPLSSEARGRMEALDETLRELIDGARLRPKRIEGAPAPPPSSPGIHPAADDLSLGPKPAAKPSKGGTLDAIAKQLDLSMTDRKKLRSVTVDQLPRSEYTSPTRSAFLAAYYAEDIVPLDGEAAHLLVPKRIVGGEEEGANLSEEARVLLGLPGRTQSPAAQKVDTDVLSARTPTDARVAAVRVGAEPTGAETRGRPTIVHLLAGGTRRGHIEGFDPSAGSVTFVEDGSIIALEEVLAIFFGLPKGEEPTAARGQKVIVKLVNDRQVAGLTEDYQEGGDALTVMPEQRRGNVDRIWIPAWAVKEIQLG
jgi:uncharacterized protein DUF6982